MLRRLKEKLTEIFVCRGKHSPTLLEDDYTIYCERCGKVLGNTSQYHARAHEERRLMEDRAYYMEKMPREIIERNEAEEREELVERLERERWLPEPSTKRRKIPRRSSTPAAQHHNAIRKHMKGKGHYAPWHRRTIKQSPKIKIEEDD